MIDLKAKQQLIAETRKNRLDLKWSILSGKTKLKAVNKKISESKRVAARNQQFDAERDMLKSSIQTSIEQYAQIEGDIKDLLNQLDEFSPKDLIEQLTDDYPFLLLPLKLETKFKSIDNRKELWIRIFPDEISINTHEELLAEEEFKSGHKYWLTIFNEVDEVVKQGAWNAVANMYNANRSAWIIKQTKPLNWDKNRPDNKKELHFPVHPQFKEGSWVQAPHVKVMPDCFIATGYSGEKIVFEKKGHLIPDDLQVGLDPSSEDMQLGRDKATGEVNVNNNVSWIMDFNKAEAAGMAMRIPLEEPYASQGVDRIVVLGLRISTDPIESSTLVESLVDNHHYSASGFSFIMQGTPTNNTEDDVSGFDSTDFANETSYEIETGANLFTISNDDLSKTDAQRFAEAIGINYQSLFHLNNANQTDVTEAKLMNTALWPGTLGYFMNEMMFPLFNDDQQNFVRDYFTQYVTGRGSIPAIRVGKQPYGILPTSSFSTWKWNTDETGKAHSHYNDLYSLLSSLGQTFEQYVSKVNYYGTIGDPYEILLNIIGVQASSVEFYQRMATDDYYTWSYLNLQNSDAALQWVPIFNKLSDSMLSAVGINPDDRPKIADVSYFDSQVQLTGQLIDANPLSEIDTILPYFQDGTNSYNYIDWLCISNTDTISRETFKDTGGATVPAPTALLYLLLRNAYLQQVWSNVNIWYQKNGLIKAPVKDQSILNVQTQPELTKMDYMMAEVEKILPKVSSSATKLTVADFVQQPSVLSSIGDQYTIKVRNSLNVLKDLPTARLERIFTEHLDLCSYRLDAWQTAMFTKRLEYLRNRKDQKSNSLQRGVYIGAFGWLEDIRPDTTALKEVNKDEIPEPLRDPGKTKLYEDPLNGGYIHGPSLDHALTAAILRNAYIAHADASNAETMSIDLSSQPVRTALYYLDGIRNGQTLSSLLGYQFERGLHDGYPTLQLDQYIYYFRDKYPLINSDFDKPSSNEKKIAPNNVVDGYALLQASKATSYPYAVTDLPLISSPEGTAISEQVKKLNDVMTAISDLALSESVYQIIQGNYERGGAVLKAFTEGKNPPEPQIVNAPRNGGLISNRVAVNFAAEPADNVWNTTLTPAATTEKGLNKWIGSLIGDPEKIRCVVSCEYADASGNTLAVSSEVRLSNVDLQPLDFVLMTDNKFGNGSSEIEKRFIYFFRRNHNIPDNILPKIQFKERDASWDESIKTIFEIIPPVRNIRQLITTCRPLHALDFMLSSEAQLTITGNMKGYVVAEIKNSTDTGRLDIVYAELEQKKTDLNNAVDHVIEPLSASAMDDLRNQLKDVSMYGIPEAFPLSATGFTSAEFGLLKSQATSVISVIQHRLDAAKELLNFIPPESKLPKQPTELDLMKSESSKIDVLLSKYSQASKYLLGSSFNLIPKFSLNNADEINIARGNNTNLLRYSTNDLGNPFIVDDWLQGIAKVRKSVRNLEEAVMFYQNIFGDYIELTVIQIPFNVNDHWAAVEFPDEMNINKDILSIVGQFPADYHATNIQSGLLIDDWTELIPVKNQTTGIAFHYDQPNAMPPQTILLAVTPEIKGHWTWQDLMDTLNETLQRAKTRAVEPDHIDESAYAQFVPAILTAFSSYPVTVSTFLSQNIMSQ